MAVTHHPLSEAPFPNVQSELSLIQLHSISLSPINSHQRDNSAARLEEVVDCNGGHPSAFSSPTKLPQLLLLSLAFWAFYHLGHPPLDTP